MPLREIIAQWDGQPQERVEIDWSNPLARDLAFAHIPSLGLQNLVTGLPPLQTSTAQAVQEVGTSGIRYRGASSYIEYDANGLQSSGNNLTLFSIWRGKDGNYVFAEEMAILSCRTAGNQGWTWGRSSAVSGGSDGNLTAQKIVFQGVAQYIEANSTIPAFLDTPVAMRVSGTTASWFYNGSKSSNDTTVGTSSTGGNLVLLGQGPFSAPSNAWAEREYVVLAWKRALSDAEIAAISSNPWQLFIRREWIVIPASGSLFNQSVSGSVTLSSAMIKSIFFKTSSTLTTSASLVKHTSVTESGSVTTSAGPVVSGAFSQNTAGSVTLTSVLTDAVTFVRTYGSVITLSGALAKPVYKLLVGSITLTATLLKHTVKATFTAALNLSSILSSFKFTPGPGGGAVGRGLRFLRRFIGRR